MSIKKACGQELNTMQLAFQGPVSFKDYLESDLHTSRKQIFAAVRGQDSCEKSELGWVLLPVPPQSFASISF
jgi:hypothetical protein